MEDYRLIADTVHQQESLLRFSHFTEEDAWNLGVFLAERVRSQGLEMAVCIRRISGHILFQHCTKGTTLSNQQWMNRKFNTVVLTEGASLRAWASMMERNQKPEDQGVSALDYAFCGGGFPIRLTSGELVGVAIVSNLPHLDDHRFIASALADYLGKDIPSI
ncbi:MAG: heme-binding protein [Clostridia bacterium]|nr:heme-binding protein [Clostridia bacterium]